MNILSKIFPSFRRVGVGFLFFLISSSVASAKVVKGKVVDAATGEPMAGVKIEAYGNSNYTAITNKNGGYSIDVPDYVSSLYMYVEGSLPQQVAIGKIHDKVDARLYCDVFSNSYTSTTETAKRSAASDFGNNVEMSIDPFLQQRLGGSMRTINRSGIEGGGSVMLINGINSLSRNAQPLVVVDGVIMDMQYDRSLIHEGYFNNLLANINVNDIDKVEVLKNGTALYGAKGANGVLLITTKRCKSMATKIDVTLGGKFQLQPRTATMMDAMDYRTYATELLTSLTQSVGSMKFLNTDPDYYYYRQYHNSTDWKKEVYRNAFIQAYGINVQGGDDVASYNVSVGYSMADETLKESDFSRFDLRINTDIEVIKDLNVRFDVSFSDVDRSLFDNGVSRKVESGTATSPSFLALTKSPFLSPYAIDIKGNTSSYLAEADDYIVSELGTSYQFLYNDMSLANPSAILAYGEGDNRNSFGNRLVSFSVNPKYKINKNLSVEEAFNFSLVNTNEDYYLPISGVPRFTMPEWSLDDAWYVAENVRQSMTARQNTIQSDTRIKWDNVYGVHAIKLMGGVRYINNSYRYNFQKGYNTGNDKTPNMAQSLAYKVKDGADDKCVDLTNYLIADYNYAQKLYVTAGLSAMASSRFGKDAVGLKAFGTVWGVFPSLQTSYVLTNEDWLAGVKGIDYLRVNAGFDITGNDDIDYSASRSYFVAKTMLNEKVNTKTLDNVGNSELKWETTRRLNVGFEGNFIDNRLHVNFNVFKGWTAGLVTLQKLAWTSGLDANYVNGGKLQNAGYNLDMSYRLLNTKDWHWELGASVGHYKNKVTEIGSDNKSILTDVCNGTVITAVGNPVGLFYGYKTDGVLATAAQAQAANLSYVDKTGKKIAYEAGDMKFVDQNNDNIISEDDRVVIGDPNPDIYGNIYTRLNWKKWTLDATFTYSLGNDIYNYERSILESGRYFYNQTTAMNRRWTTEGQVTDIPRVSYRDAQGNARFSDRWIEDGSYLRLSNVTLNYSLPISNTYIQGITVWGAAYNLFTLTHYLGSNPDCSMSSNVLYQGIDCGLLGTGRSFAMGVKINL
ncbi:MAG: SusC/RagA family TonB-linked outer membrane protein [Prevotella sp.]|nr:SusC/RagA family TonB-linked outer membrane protein [Prevotella sp.]